MWGFLLLLLVAGLLGSIGQAITGFSRGGCLVSIAIGFVGAVLGRFLQQQLGLPEPFELDVDDFKFPVVWTIIGSALFVAVIGFLTRGRRGPQ